MVEEGYSLGVVFSVIYVVVRIWISLLSEVFSTSAPFFCHVGSDATFHSSANIFFGPISYYLI